MKTACSFLFALLCCSVSLDAAAGNCNFHAAKELDDLKTSLMCLEPKVTKLYEELNKDIEDKQVAFSASLSKSNERKVGPNVKTLVFEQVDTNIGGAFDPTTGIFTAPVKGVYHFELHALGEGKHPVGAILMKNGRATVSSYTYQNVDFRQSATNSVNLVLESRDQVYVSLQQTTMMDNYNHHTTFSGHLLFLKSD